MQYSLEYTSLNFKGPTADEQLELVQRDPDQEPASQASHSCLPPAHVDAYAIWQQGLVMEAQEAMLILGILH